MSTQINGYTSEDKNIYRMYDEILQKLSLLADNEQFITVTNVVITPEQWIESITYSDYGYCADITVDGVDSLHWSPDVRLGAKLEADGKIGFSSIDDLNTVSLYATEGYEENITIPVIICQKVASEV